MAGEAAQQGMELFQDPVAHPSLHERGRSARVERREPALTERLRAWGGGRPSGDFLMRRLKAAFDPAGILEPGRSAVG